MVLFILEGEKREPVILESIKKLFFQDKEENYFVVSYCNNIVNLYKEMTSADIIMNKKECNSNCNYVNGIDLNSNVNLFEILKKKHPDDNNLSVLRLSQISEIYLFFDCDLHNQNVEDFYPQVECLLEYFSNETENGKLFINYPMVESLFYFKNKLPDPDFINYCTDLYGGKKFKKEVGSALALSYGNHAFLCPSKKYTESELQTIEQNWHQVIIHTIRKANLICNDKNSIPRNKSEVDQKKLFSSQKEKFMKRKLISIISSFPLFLFEYFLDIDYLLDCTCDDVDGEKIICEDANR